MTWRRRGFIAATLFYGFVEYGIGFMSVTGGPLERFSVPWTVASLATGGVLLAIWEWSHE